MEDVPRLQRQAARYGVGIRRRGEPLDRQRVHPDGVAAPDRERDANGVALLLDVRPHRRAEVTRPAVEQRESLDIARDLARRKKVLVPSDVRERHTERQTQQNAAARPGLHDRAQRVLGEWLTALEIHADDLTAGALRDLRIQLGRRRTSQTPRCRYP